MLRSKGRSTAEHIVSALLSAAGHTDQRKVQLLFPFAESVQVDVDEEVKVQTPLKQLVFAHLQGVVLY